jgi:rhodanese-related sulfurtransferase
VTSIWQSFTEGVVPATASAPAVLDATELQARLRSGAWKPGQIVDVRTPAEFRSGHVPGSRNLPLDILQGAELEQLKTETASVPLVLTCASGVRAATAADRLRQAGASDVWVLVGGVAAWKELHLPLNQTGNGWALERQVRFVAGLLVLIGCGLGYWISAHFYALAALVGAGLVFSALTNTCGMATVLAKMPWNR